MDVAIVTGASRGIGKVTALLLASRYAVVVNYLRNEAKAMETVAAIEARGGKALAVQGDVSEYQDARKIVKEGSKIGDIKVLVNNAGVYDVRPFSATMPSQWEQIFQVNVFGVFNMISAVLDYMEEGVIVNIASIIGKNPIAHAAPYCSSKAAVIALTQSLAREFGNRIRIVCVAPGPTDTDMLRKFHGGGFGDPPEKVASYILRAIESGKNGECIVVE